MAPNSAIRKAIGVVKDQTRISIAKVTSNLDPELDILIVRATSHDYVVPNDKLHKEILRRGSISKELVNECVGLISKRISRTHDWIVALKCLILVHKLMIDGGKIFMEEIACANSSNVKGSGMLSNMCVFKDESHSNSWEYTEFVRRYGMYLDEKVELMVFDELWLKRRSRGLGGLEEKYKKMGLAKLSDEMVTERVLSWMEQLQRLLERVLAMRLRMAMSKHRKLAVIALCSVVEESFKVYGDICEGLTLLLDLFWGMEYWNVVKSLGTYVTVAKQIDELVEFYAWCKDFGIGTMIKYPVVEKISDDLLTTMEKFMKKKASELKNNKKNESGEASMKRETPESSASLGIRLRSISEDFADDFQELINLRDAEEIQVAEPYEKLALPWLCDDQAGFTGNNKSNPWENVSDNSEIAKIASDSETQLANPANTEWEVALVESASILKNQETELCSSLDDFGIPEPKWADSSQATSGENAVLAWPSPNGLLQMVEQDPFAVSETVSSHAYAQVPKMLEQQFWQGQISSVQNNVVLSYYDFGPQATVPSEVAGNSGNPGGNHYNPWSN